MEVVQVKQQGHDLGLINGFPIIGAFTIPNRTGRRKDGRVIFVDRGEGHRQRYVVSVCYAGEPGWTQGVYRTEFTDALTEFVQLVKAWGSP